MRERPDVPVLKTEPVDVVVKLTDKWQAFPGSRRMEDVNEDVSVRFQLGEPEQAWGDTHVCPLEVGATCTFLPTLGLGTAS